MTATAIMSAVRVLKTRVAEDQDVRASVRREVVTIQELGTAGNRAVPPLVRTAGDAGCPNDIAT